MPYTLRQASSAVGKERTTLLRAIQAGKLSAARNEVTGSWLIDPAELHRVYPPIESVERTGAEEPDTATRTPDSQADAQAENCELRIRLEAAEAGNRLRDDVITDLRAQRDREAAERRQAYDRLAEVQTKLTAILTDQRATPAAPVAPQPAPPTPPRRPWFRWRR